jgi:hypothetical protein
MVMSGKPPKDMTDTTGLEAPRRPRAEPRPKAAPFHADERTTRHEPRLGAARGLLLGLAIGLVLWIAIIGTVWWLLKA